MEWQFLIGGELVPALEGHTAKIINPHDGSNLAEVPLASPADVDRAVKAAREAFPAWSARPSAERARALLKLADRLEEHGEELAQLESQDVGKPISLARSEIPFMADNLRFLAGAARSMEGRSAGEYTEGRTSWVRREPIGVVGSIAPWNYPLMMAIWKIGPALATGNTVVLKPAEITPLTTLRLGQLAADLFPAGVLNILNGLGKSVGAAITAHPDVDMVSLTGDVGTGQAVARSAASNLKRVHLELGGKAPVIVYDDADLELAVETIRLCGYMNSGQDCTAACRVYAQKGIYDKFVELLLPAVQSLQTGPPAEDKTEMGPMVSANQRHRVVGFIDRARQQSHIEVLCGGKEADGPGFYYPPTLLAGAENHDEVVQREVFGPVVTVTRFEDEAQAIEFANGVAYGLSSSVWTRSLDRALDATRRLKFGCVWINDHCTLVSEMPHGGYKQSGYGKDLSRYALEDYTDVKHIMARIR